MQEFNHLQAYLDGLMKIRERRISANENLKQAEFPGKHFLHEPSQTNNTHGRGRKCGRVVVAG